MLLHKIIFVQSVNQHGVDWRLTSGTESKKLINKVNASWTLRYFPTGKIQDLALPACTFSTSFCQSNVMAWRPSQIDLFQYKEAERLQRAFFKFEVKWRLVKYILLQPESSFKKVFGRYLSCTHHVHCNGFRNFDFVTYIFYLKTYEAI